MMWGLGKIQSLIIDNLCLMRDARREASRSNPAFEADALKRAAQRER
jgi:hypothetical protein